jgi:hypothetical protein
MTVNELEKILTTTFNTIDHIGIFHLTGGGEPFLHKQLADLIECSMKYNGQFEKLMLFTNCTIFPTQRLSDTIKKYRDRLIIQVSLYGVNPKHEEDILSTLETTGAKLKIEKYYGDDQSFGGWVDFGEWKSQNRPDKELCGIFKNCAVTRDMRGNWRTRDGKVHWCSRSMRGMELGFIPDNPNDYVDLFNEKETKEQKRRKFTSIANAKYISACDYCTGNHGIDDVNKRFKAAEQIKN